MTTAKTTKSIIPPVSDPFASVRETILEAVTAAKAQQEKITGAAQAEADKARAAAKDGFEKAIATYRENFETAISATKAAAESFAKIEELARTQAAQIAEDRVAGMMKALSVTDPAQLMKLQAELLVAEQKKAEALAKETAALYQGVANDFFKPVQAQMTKAFEQVSKFKAA